MSARKLTVILPRLLRRRAVGGGLRDGFCRQFGFVVVSDTLCGPASETDGGEMNRDAWPKAVCKNWPLLCLMKKSAFCWKSNVMTPLAFCRYLAIPNCQRLCKPSVIRLLMNGVVRVYLSGRAVLNEALDDLRRCWDETSYEICRRRDDVACAEEEHQRDYENDPGLFAKLPQTWKAEFR